ncbi:IS110 family transposase [Lacibacterium aquatile]|uniref:IS110 family transposase n=1 Tax=Lacibacterium aquatile TaxID=1168082 RepID=A0ABW5DUG1_9PROT
MTLTIGIDVGLEVCHLCAVDPDGKVIVETTMPSTPEHLADCCDLIAESFDTPINLVALEAGSISLWLAWGLRQRRYIVKMLNPSSTSAWFKAAGVKSDKHDAIAIAQIGRTGWSRDVWIRSPESHAVRAALKTRDLLVAQRRGLESRLGYVLKAIGLDRPKQGAFGLVLDRRTKTLPPIALLPLQTLKQVIDATHAAITSLDELIRAYAEESPAAKRLQSIPGVGALTALAFTAAIDDPSRFASGRQVASYFGLAPRLSRTGTKHVGPRGISRRGDIMTRTLLCQAAMRLTYGNVRQTALGNWGRKLALSRSGRKVMAAVGRKLAVQMFAMLRDGSDYVDPGLAANATGS